MSDKTFLMVTFCIVYQTLLRAEAHAMQPDQPVENLAVVHNIFEEARGRVVEAYLPYRTSNERTICGQR